MESLAYHRLILLESWESAVPYFFLCSTCELAV